MFKDIIPTGKLNKNELLLILKNKASNIRDIMQASIFLSEDAKYVQKVIEKNTLNLTMKYY